MRHLPLIILPQRLERITSLELVWNLALHPPGAKSTKVVKEGWSTYDALLQIVPSAFPKLEKLYLSLALPWTSEEARADESFEHRLLYPVDEMARNFGLQLRTFHLMLPVRYYRYMMKRAKEAGTRTDDPFRDGFFFIRRFWRPVSVPKALCSEREIGYWVKEGVMDIPWESGCFGTSSGGRHEMWETLVACQDPRIPLSCIDGISIT